MPDRKSKYSTLHKKMKTRKCKRNASTNENKIMELNMKN